MAQEGSFASNSHDKRRGQRVRQTLSRRQLEELFNKCSAFLTLQFLALLILILTVVLPEIPWQLHIKVLTKTQALVAMHYLQPYPINAEAGLRLCSLQSPSKSQPIKGPAPLKVDANDHSRGWGTNETAARNRRKRERWRKDGEVKSFFFSLSLFLKLL